MQGLIGIFYVKKKLGISPIFRRKCLTEKALEVLALKISQKFGVLR